jgi:hypothetical protein
VGIALGLVHKWERGRLALRGIGALIALAGAWFVWTAVAG